MPQRDNRIWLNNALTVRTVPSLFGVISTELIKPKIKYTVEELIDRWDDEKLSTTSETFDIPEKYMHSEGKHIIELLKEARNEIDMARVALAEVFGIKKPTPLQLLHVFLLSRAYMGLGIESYKDINKDHNDTIREYVMSRNNK